MTNKKQSLVPGIILIGIGFLLLSPRIGRGFDTWDHALPLFVILLALTLIIETARNHNRNSLFWGIVLIFIGSFYICRNFNFIPYFYIDEYWPLFLIAPGFGVLIQSFVYHKEHKGFISGIVMITIGMFLLLFTLPYDFDNVEYYVSKFWPLIFLLLGAILIVNSIRNINHETDDNNKTDVNNTED